MSIGDDSDSYSQVVLAKGPVGYWRLGEPGGPAALDSSANGNGGTYYGDPSFGQPGAINNDPDTAVGFKGPGSGDYAEVPDPDSQSFSQPASGAGLTVEVWMRPDALLFSGEPGKVSIHGVSERHADVAWCLSLWCRLSMLGSRV